MANPSRYAQAPCTAEASVSNRATTREPVMGACAHMAAAVNAAHTAMTYATMAATNSAMTTRRKTRLGCKGEQQHKGSHRSVRTTSLENRCVTAASASIDTLCPKTIGFCRSRG